MSTTITIRLSDDLRAELEKISDREDKPPSDVVRESLRRYIAIQQFRRLRRKVLSVAESQSVLTDDDIFESLE